MTRGLILPKPLPGTIEHTPKGMGLFPFKYFVMYICSKRGSGKTVLIYNLIKKLATKRTRIIHVSSTIDKDEMNQRMVAEFQEKYPFYETMMSMDEIDFDTAFKLEDDEPDEDEDTDSSLPLSKISNLLFEKPPRPGKIKKPITPLDNLLILDDISPELQSKDLARFVKVNRHHRTRIIISSQYLNDLSKTVRSQVDYAIVFKGMEDRKMKELRRGLDLGISDEELLEKYKKMTEKPYSFMTIDVRKDLLRQGI